MSVCARMRMFVCERTCAYSCVCAVRAHLPSIIRSPPTLSHQASESNDEVSAPTSNKDKKKKQNVACACLCVCVRARACVCARACVRVCGARVRVGVHACVRHSQPTQKAKNKGKRITKKTGGGGGRSGRGRGNCAP